MRKFIFVLSLLVAIQSFSQWPWDKIEGNGKMKKEIRSVTNYTAIASSGSWDVMIGYGESNSIEVEGDENLLYYIETKVEDGKLTIKTTKNVNLRSKNRITVYVSLKKMTGVSLSGSGDIMGVGNFSNDGKTDFKISGSGSIKISFEKVNTAEIVISGSGNIGLIGSASTVNVKISGSGNADCSALICEDATAHISGSGNVKVYTNRSIDASISGSGNVQFKGAASDIKKHISGSGRVIKA